jgi:hypothetical protein
VFLSQNHHTKVRIYISSFEYFAHLCRVGDTSEEPKATHR